jgi:hypothetical protein
MSAKMTCLASLALLCCLVLVDALVIQHNGVAGGDRVRAFREHGIAVDTPEHDVFRGKDVIPVNSTGFSLTADQTKIVGATSGILYHGGNVLSNSPAIYLIFYGNWAGSTTPSILIDLSQNQASATYASILQTYYSKTATQFNFVQGYARWGGVTYDTSYTYGTSLTDQNILDIVSYNIKKGTISGGRVVSNALYFVITSADVTATSGMCTKYCGWHTSAVLGNGVVRYSYLGSPLRCPNSCSKAQSVYPNDNREADGIANILMHELVESMSDADVDAWYDGTYMENADKCAWNFGTTYTAPNGATANMKIGTRHYLVQQNWVNANGGYCGLKYTPS